ncbi:MAG: lysylphosphatidylglycerol synthase transmembrane domain-containing protein [Emergencia sp.]|nr:lysylphosphatidylglycerol synthase transmembrane domain-containing protein [Emergencia sp.]
MMRLTKKKKVWINSIFLLICLALTLYYVFHGEDLERLLDYIEEAEASYWIPGVGLVVAFILSESIIIHYLMRSLRQKTKLSHCFFYSFVGFFFSLVTPSASGGQPMQIVFMKKDKLPIHLSTLVLLIVTITYKLVLVIFGLCVVILRPAAEMTVLKPAMAWIYLGIILNVVCVGAMLALVFWPDLAKRLVMAMFRLIRRTGKFARADVWEDKLNHAMEGYRQAASYFWHHKIVIFNVLVITLAQRCFLFMITYLALKSLGIGNISMSEAIVLQAMISVAVDMLPLPGGLGISEHLFKLIFLPICGSMLLTPALIVSRGISFYTQLLISAVFTVVGYFVIFRGKNNDRIL